MKELGNEVHVNIRYPLTKIFETKTNSEKNRIGSDVIHQALIRVAEYDNKLTDENIAKQ